jgi:hypothetical protein
MSTRFCSAWTVGGSDAAGLPTLGWGIASDGWTGFVKRNIQPELTWGCKRFCLFKPFGKAGSAGAQQFDSLHDLYAAGRGGLLRDFEAAWYPLTKSGVEVIGYLGKITGDPSFAGATPAQWLRRFVGSVQLLLDAGMSVAFDASSHELPTSPVFRAAHLLRSLGVKVYVEPRPHENATGWFDYPIIVTNQSWSRADPDRHADAGPLARNAQLTGEIVRFIHEPPRPPDTNNWDNQLAWAPDAIRAIVAAGHTACFPALGLIKAGVKLADLVTV